MKYTTPILFALCAICSALGYFKHTKEITKKNKEYIALANTCIMYQRVALSYHSQCQILKAIYRGNNTQVMIDSFNKQMGYTNALIDSATILNSANH